MAIQLGLHLTVWQSPAVPQACGEQGCVCVGGCSCASNGSVDLHGSSQFTIDGATHKTNDDKTSQVAANLATQGVVHLAHCLHHVPTQRSLAPCTCCRWASMARCITSATSTQLCLRKACTPSHAIARPFSAPCQHAQPSEPQAQA
jgi:hypothetical protein